MSEIPLDRLSRLRRHGTFGIGFAKDLIRTRDGAPVWYLWRDTPVQARFQEVVGQAMKGSIDPADPIWQLTLFVDNPGSGDWGRYEFDWEREWRVSTELKFQYSDVEFLIVDGPAGTNNQSILGQYWAQQTTGPTPPMFALDWPIERLQEVLADTSLSDKRASSA